MNKKLSIGIDDFKSINEECYYADKTLLIKDLIDLNKGSVVLYTRPRRFGKSLNLSMIKSFFDINDSTSNYFIDKNISKCGDKYLSNINSLPVISLTFNGIVGKSFHEMMLQFKEQISKLYISYQKKVFESLDNNEQQKYMLYLNKTLNDDQYINCLSDFCYFLNKHYHKKCLLLIDEYDTPLINAVEENFFHAAIKFFKKLYYKTFKENSNLELGVIFGVLEIKKDFLFTGLNNIIFNNILTVNKIEHFGFNEDDVNELLKLYDINESINKIKLWYGGYNLSNIEIYNPWSILNYLKTKVFDFYWINTGSNSLIKPLLKNKSLNIIKLLHDLINSNYIIKNIDFSSCYFKYNKKIKSLLTLLLSTGYLTIVKIININTYQIGLPNEEIKQLFKIVFD